MKKTTLLLSACLLLVTPGFTQWQSTGGPNGGFTDELAILGNSVFVAAGNGGIYRSTDNGITWNLSASGLPLNETTDDIFVHNGSLYAALSRSGVYQSADNGVNWSAINTGVETRTFLKLFVSGIEIYAGDANGGIYYSGDNGTTWTDKSEGVENVQFQGFSSFGSAIYGGGSPFSAESPALFKSTDSGDTWEEIEVVGLGPNGVRSMTATENNLFVGDDDGIFISPDGAEWEKSTLNVGGTIKNMGVSGDSVFLTTDAGVFYYSTNEGTDWTMVENTATSSFTNDIALLEDRILMSTNEGLYSSLDNGQTWMTANAGLNALPIRSLACTQDTLFAGSEQGGIFQFTSTSGWSNISPGLEGFSSSTVNDIVIVKNEVIIGTNGGVFVSTNFEEDWVQTFEPDGRQIQVLDYDKGVFVAGVNGQGVYISSDTAETFTLAETNGITTETSYSSILIEGDTIVVGTVGGELFLSTNLGTSWANISISDDLFTINDLDHTDARIYAGTTRGLVISEDLGSTWSFFNNEQLVILDMELIGTKVYAATSTGIFVTATTKEVWSDVSDNLGSLFTNTLLVKGNTLIAGALAASVWEIPLVETNLSPDITSPPTAEATEDVLFTYIPTASDPENDNINYSIDNHSGWITIADNVVSGTPMEGNLEGTFELIAIDENGASSMQTVAVMVTPVNDPPTITDYLGAATVPGNRSLAFSLTDFTVTDVDNAFPDDFTLTILAGENYEVNGSAISPAQDFVGTITVVVTVNDGELDSEEFSIEVEVTEPLGFDYNAFLRDFSIYPNPTHDHLKISGKGGSTFSLAIFTLQGKEVLNMELVGGTEQRIDLSTLTPGVYLLKVRDEQQEGSMQLVVGNE